MLSSTPPTSSKSQVRNLSLAKTYRAEGNRVVVVDRVPVFCKRVGFTDQLGPRRHSVIGLIVMLELRKAVNCSSESDDQ